MDVFGSWWSMQAICEEMFFANFNIFKTALFYQQGISREINGFLGPYWTSLEALMREEKKNVRELPLNDSLRDYMELVRFSLMICEQGNSASFGAAQSFHEKELYESSKALINTLFGNGNGNGACGWGEYWKKQEKLAEVVAMDYPSAIKNIEPEFGFHFDDGGYRKIAETDRFILYQVLPWKNCTEVDRKKKPVLIIPPYVLGASILGFLPGHEKSYAHSYANQGIPTYLRVIKNINESQAVQIMTGEDDCLDMKEFAEVIFKLRGRKITVNGFCQGGFVSLLNILSGKLDDFVDAFITCVTPIDGTRSQSLKEYLAHIPLRFRNLAYAGKKLPNGNIIIDGKVMSWVYKLKSMEREAPVFTFYRDLKLFGKSPDPEKIRINATAAALNYWLLYERNDLPMGITQLSFDSYTKPISAGGIMPVTLFGEKLNIKRINEKKIPWLICYADEDDLVNREAALAATDYIDAEVTVFPKGHGAIATSWSYPESECALHTRFAGGRGPVRYQLDLS